LEEPLTRMYRSYSDGEPRWRRAGACSIEVALGSAPSGEACCAAVVPLSELGDFKVSKTMDAWVVYAPGGSHAGHVYETWRLTGEVNDGGFPLTKRLMFRGTPVRDARPGYP
jgi:hypothetical protein